MNASAIKEIHGSLISYRGNDIDTDRILPARFMKRLTFDGLETGLFVDERKAFSSQGKTHVFDDKRFADSSILIVNENFGCGSSREHAPQSLYRHGIRCIIGESFGEIFASNCMTIGLPVLRADKATVAELQKQAIAAPELKASVNLETREIRAGSASAKLSIDEGARTMFLEGRWDSVGEMLAARNRILELDAMLPALVAQ
ncbi:MAG: 3-isopropylmalate dehydratase small subunit [Leptospirales bacterium]|nr:3-isopropylmalate dehydratase small subunit [Leptospirales bacterium]